MPYDNRGILSRIVDEGVGLARPIVPQGVQGAAAPMVFPKPAIIRTKPEYEVRKAGGDGLHLTDKRGKDFLITYLLNRFQIPNGPKYTGMNMSFGDLGSFGRSVGLNKGLNRLDTVKESLYNILPKIRPDTLDYSAGAPNLRPLYDRVTNRIAKDFEGVPHIGKRGAYSIAFPKAQEQVGSDPQLNALLDKYFRTSGSF